MGAWLRRLLPLMSEKPHRFQAVGCMEGVLLNRLMCDAHWKIVPESVKIALFAVWEPDVPHEKQLQPVQTFISMAVQQVAIVERKAMT